MHLGSNVKEIKGMSINFKVVVDERKKFNKSSSDLRGFVDDRKISKSHLDLNIFRFVKDKKMSENYNCKWGWMPMVAMLGLNWRSKPPDSDIRRM